MTVNVLHSLSPRIYSSETSISFGLLEIRRERVFSFGDRVKKKNTERQKQTLS